MQRWRKVLLIVTVLFMILGGALGYILVKSGFGGAKVIGKINIFQCLIALALIIMFFSVVYDLCKLCRVKKRLGTVRFIVMIKTRKRMKVIVIFEFVIAIIEFVLFNRTHELVGLLMGIIILFLAIIFGVHNSIKNEICENGILYWGVFYDWKVVKTYLFDGDTILKIKVCEKTFGLKYNNQYNLIINPDEKDDIKKLIQGKVKTC